MVMRARRCLQTCDRPRFTFPGLRRRLADFASAPRNTTGQERCVELGGKFITHFNRSEKLQTPKPTWHVAYICTTSRFVNSDDVHVPKPNGTHVETF